MKWVKRLGIAFSTLVLIGAVGYSARHDLMRMQSDLPPFTHGAGEKFDVMVPMEDGVKLYTTVQLPDGEGPFPAVLIRSPYTQISFALRNLLCGRFVRYGYACLLQDTRGQGKSEGGWNPGGNVEIADGRDALNWLVMQDFQDGNLAMVGSSYLASVQFSALAGGAPTELKTIVPSMYTTDNRGAAFQDGLFRHETYTAWASMMRGSNSEGLSGAGDDYQKAIRHRPHNTVDTEIFGMAMPWYQSMIAASSPKDEHWHGKETAKVRDVPENISIPILMIGGWYDVFFGPQFEDWQRLATQSNSRYIVGPYTHPGGFGDLDMPNAEGGRFQWAEMLPWLEHHLKGKPLATNTGLKLYVIGDGEWQEHKNWPMPNRIASYNLANLPASNECEGGELTTRADTNSGQARFVYDPDNPVPTRGGAGMLAFNIPGFGGADPSNVEQSGLCERDDVLTFQTDALTEDMLISGKVSVTLDVSSSAPDTAFSAKLIEVFPDGRAYNIRDSITTLAYRNGADTPQNYTPGDRLTVTIDFWPIAWRLQPGSRLRLDISSSDFPKFHAHTNRAGPWEQQDGADKASQTIYGGRLDLPVEGCCS
ncbi:MAG: CocE/NonD family hydrolase [Alphaproteobacteria bacterium]